MAVEARPKGTVIKARPALLSKGRTTEFVARGDSLGVAVKVYAEGGENALHAHTNGDHLHFVLDGQATFYDEEGNATVVNKNQGMYLPKGAYYYFQCTGGGNLVLLSSYAYEAGETGEGRLGIDGKALPGESVENKHVEGVPIPGKFYGD